MAIDVRARVTHILPDRLYFWYLDPRHEARKLQEAIVRAIVAALPDTVIYYALIRAWVHATSGEAYGRTEVPAVAMDRVVRRWEARTNAIVAEREIIDLLAEEAALRASHDEIEATYGIRPGESCASCGVPITAEEITHATAGAVATGGAAYHHDHAPEDDDA